MWKLQLQFWQLLQQIMLEMMKMEERGTNFPGDFNTHNDIFFTAWKIRVPYRILGLIISFSKRIDVQSTVAELLNRRLFDKKLKESILVKHELSLQTAGRIHKSVRYILTTKQISFVLVCGTEEENLATSFSSKGWVSAQWKENTVQSPDYEGH